VRTEVVGVTGQDESGELLLQLMRGQGASVQGVLQLKDRPTESKTRILAGGQATTPQQIVRLDQGAQTPLQLGQAERLLSKLEQRSKQASLLMVSDYALGTLHPLIQKSIARLAKRIPVLVDARYDLLSYRGAALLKPNLPEAEAASGVEIRDRAAAARAANKLIKLVGARAVLLTRGHEGLCLVERGGQALHLPPHGTPDAVDVTGAGDTVFATVAAGLAAGWGLKEATRLANIAGGQVVQEPGTAVVQLGRLLQAYHEDLGHAR